MQRRISFVLVCTLFLAACSTPAASYTLTAGSPIITSTPVASHTMMPTLPAPSPTPVPEQIADPTPLPASATSEVKFQVCSPLAGYPLEGLEGIVSNPYNPPKPGSDDPHQAVDLADRLDGSGMALAGMAVQAVLPGRVALAQADRFPYGNAVIVETSLQHIPEPLWEILPSAAPLWTPNPALSCPQVAQPDAQSPVRSVYVLYAHLQDPPQVQVGESLLCGQVIGKIGQSGNALAPHLHLEIRAGPAGWQTASLAHYTNSASFEEMGQYCTWRVSGIFQHLDPLQWLEELTTPKPDS